MYSRGTEAAGDSIPPNHTVDDESNAPQDEEDGQPDNRKIDCPDEIFVEIHGLDESEEREQDRANDNLQPRGIPAAGARPRRRTDRPRSCRLDETTDF